MESAKKWFTLPQLEDHYKSREQAVNHKTYCESLGQDWFRWNRFAQAWQYRLIEITEKAVNKRSWETMRTSVEDHRSACFAYEPFVITPGSNFQATCPLRLLNKDLPPKNRKNAPPPLGCQHSGIWNMPCPLPTPIARGQGCLRDSSASARIQGLARASFHGMRVRNAAAHTCSSFLLRSCVHKVHSSRKTWACQDLEPTNPLLLDQKKAG